MILERMFHLSSALLAVTLLRGLAVLAAGFAVTALARNAAPGGCVHGGSREGLGQRVK